MKKILNLKELLIRSSEKYSEKIAYKLINKKITYKKLLEDVNSLGTSLLNIGLNNKNIGIISENRYEWEISYLAISCGVGIVTPLDKKMPKNEIINIIKKANIEAIICSNKYIKIIKEIKNKYNLKYIISIDEEKHEEGIYSFGKLLKQGNNLIKQGNNEYINKKINEEELGFIYFTSGTTSKSKAVMLSHKNICSSIINASKIFDISQEDKILSVLPLNHVLEGIFCFLTSIYKGATRIHNKEIKEILNEIEKYDITFMGGVPQLYEYIYEQLIIEERYKKIAKKINIFFCGGAILNPNLKEKYKKLGINLIQGYGLTENSPVVSLENKENQKIGSVGKIIPNIKIKIENKDEKGIGELLIKGDTVMLGYYKNKEETKKCIKNNWLNTGDLAKIDEQGYLYIQGRKKDVIVLNNGKNIYPEEIEEKINKIKGVKESFVFGKSKTIFDDSIKICAEIIYDKIYFKDKKIEEIEKIEKYIIDKIKKINLILPHYKSIKEIYIKTKPIYKNENGKIKRKIEKEKINEKGLIEIT